MKWWDKVVDKLIEPKPQTCTDESRAIASNRGSGAGTVKRNLSEERI